MTIYESQKNKIVLSDVMDYIKTIPEKSIDLIIADPPYFQVYGEFDFVFKNEKEYVEWCKKWLFECKRILKDTGTLILYGSLGKKQITFARIAIMIEDEKMFLVREQDNVILFLFSLRKSIAGWTKYSLYSSKISFPVFEGLKNDTLFHALFITE